MRPPNVAPRARRHEILVAVISTEPHRYDVVDGVGQRTTPTTAIAVASQDERAAALIVVRIATRCR
jgi:hypothetical protein